MTAEISGTQINYYRMAGSFPMLLLHGWGCDGNIFRKSADYFNRLGADVIVPDFPGFGASGPAEGFDVYSYAKRIRGLIAKLGIPPPIILGHSFGGRIGVILASEGLADKLILVDAAGLKPRLSIAKRLRISAYKRAARSGKPLDKFGSEDYRALSEGMKSVFVRVVNRDLSAEAKKIVCPTLLVWGRNDRETPLYMAKRYKKLIKNSRLKVLDGGHYSFLDSASEFAAATSEFIWR